MSNRESVITDRELAAVVAHGLMNTLAAVCGAATMLKRYETRLTDVDREELLRTIVDQSAVFSDGLVAILSHCSDAFGDAATTMALSAHCIRSLPPAELPNVINGLIAHCSVLELGLSAMVRGLSPEVLEYLNSIQRSPGGDAPRG